MTKMPHSMRLGAVLGHKQRLADMATEVRAPGYNYVETNGRPIRPVEAPPVMESPRLRLRDREQVSPSKLAVRAGELIRQAYSDLQSAGALVMTLANSADSRGDTGELGTLELIRQVCRDASADVSQAAYRLPLSCGSGVDPHGALPLPVVANGRGALANFT